MLKGFQGHNLWEKRIYISTCKKKGSLQHISAGECKLYILPVWNINKEKPEFKPEQRTLGWAKKTHKLNNQTVFPRVLL